MGQPELTRNDNISVGNGNPDAPTHQPKDTIGPVPEGNVPGHKMADDPDKPKRKFIDRFARRSRRRAR